MNSGGRVSCKYFRGGGGLTQTLINSGGRVVIFYINNYLGGKGVSGKYSRIKLFFFTIS